MKIKIETLSNAPGKTFTYDFTVAEAALSLNEEDMQVTAPLEVQMRAAYRDEKVEVEGSLRTRVILTCSRCLKRFLFSVNEEFADEMPMENEAEIDLFVGQRNTYYHAALQTSLSGSMPRSLPDLRFGSQ